MSSADSLARLLCRVNNGGEDGRFVLPKMCEHLPIKRNLRGLQPVHETAVGDAVGTDRGVDADVPLAPVYPLLLFSPTVGIGAGLQDGSMGGAHQLLSAPAVPFRLLQQAAALSGTDGSSFDSHDG